MAGEHRRHPFSEMIYRSGDGECFDTRSCGYREHTPPHSLIAKFMESECECLMTIYEITARLCDWQNPSAETYQMLQHLQIEIVSAIDKVTPHLGMGTLSWLLSDNEEEP